MTEIVAPFQQFFDTSGRPLANGAIYIGSVNLDAQTNPIAVYWDEALTIPAAQPIRTLNGYPVRNGAPARLFANVANYSITVRNAQNRLMYSLGDATSVPLLSDPDGSSLVGFIRAEAGAVARTAEDKLREHLSLKDFGAIGDGVADDTAAIDAWLAAVMATGKPGYWGEGHFRYTGERLEIVIGGLAATQGGKLIGAGYARTIVDVTACTGEPQFLIRAGAVGGAPAGAVGVFGWTINGFEVRGIRDGVMGQIMQNFDGSDYPDALNSSDLTDLVFRNNSLGTNAVAVRINAVLQSRIHIIANNGNPTALNGSGVELHGLQFSTGLIAAGGAQYGITFRHFTYGNRLNLDMEVVRHVVQFDSAVAGWNALEGTMVWGAPNATEALSGNDFSTTAIIATQANAPQFFTEATNWSGVPTISGAAQNNIVIRGRGYGVERVQGLQFRPARSTDDANIFMEAPIGQSAWSRFIRQGSPDVLRWLCGVGSDETFQLQRYNASGVFQDVPYYVNPSTGEFVVNKLVAVQPPQIPSYTVATLPSASPASRMAFVSNESGGAVLAFSDGANWRRVTDRAIVT
ncbi:Bacteriophage P22 tailspike, N-terminal [uncultured Caudovirales phage]|uniref:Bacteriophage P22 tailspike, N-terminal n=1 Tax=uncultured Caudovirales phage TaxID=2100421 RepID=A0A6J5NCR6_9CAUD|nr:Bacteriophage P22 tailspike, N-terminal [uncultured Caudovirales phage]